MERNAKEVDRPPDTQLTEVVRMSAVLEQSGGSEPSLVIVAMPFIPLEEVVLGLLEGVLLLVGQCFNTKAKEEEQDGDETQWGEHQRTLCRKQGKRTGKSNEEELLVTSDKKQVEDDPTKRIPYPFVEYAPAVVLLTGIPASACKVVGKA